MRGKTIRLNDVPFEVVGVTGASYRGLSQGASAADRCDDRDHAQPLISPEGPRQSLFTAPGVFWVRLIARVARGR
jgi:hypothetical protein